MLITHFHDYYLYKYRIGVPMVVCLNKIDKFGDGEREHRLGVQYFSYFVAIVTPETI